MMKTLRLAVAATAILGLGAGYLASQVAFFQGAAAEYAQALDGPIVRWLSLALLAVAIVLAFVPSREGEDL